MHVQNFLFKQNQRGNQKWIDAIEKDLHRNFPTHELFGGVYERIGQSELYRVLKAYSVLNPVDGYCQAMAPIAAQRRAQLRIAEMRRQEHPATHNATE